MARIVKRKVRRLRKGVPLGIAFTIVLLSWLAVNLYVKTQNASLTMKIQQMNDEISELTNQNQLINIEINNLENKDRIYAVAQATNLNQIQDNIIVISED